MKTYHICVLTPSNRDQNQKKFGIECVPAVGYDGLASHLRPKFEPLPLFREKNWGDYGFPHTASAEARVQHRAAMLRLVEAPQCPTNDEIFEKAYLKYSYHFSQLKQSAINRGFVEDNYPQKVNFQERGKQITPLGVQGAKTVIEYRKWSDEYRVRTAVQAYSGAVPVAKTGERITDRLTPHAAKKIGDSASFIDKTRGGYPTFVTGTFSQERRDLINAGKSSIQKEVSRSMDALSKMYYRGFTAGDGRRVRGAKVVMESKIEMKIGNYVKVDVPHDDGIIAGDYREVKFYKKNTIKEGGFAYCWVVEIPKNEKGGDNPHVHILMDWRVSKQNFKDWAFRLERIWGNGHFHLEKMRKSGSAGAYLLKAAGYLNKGGDGSQGVVRGNRYGISEAARAPLFEVYGEGQLHSMGQLISECYDNISAKYGHVFSNRRRLLETLGDEKLSKDRRRNVGEKLEEVRAYIKKMPIACTRYQVILKGWPAAARFFAWAKGENTVAEWLPDKLEPELAWIEGERPKAHVHGHFDMLHERLKAIRARRRHLKDEVLCKIHEYFEMEYADAKNEAFSCYENYQNYCNNLKAA